MPQHTVTEAGPGASAMYERFAGIAALIVALGGIGYSIAFVVLLQNGSKLAARLTALFLLIGGLLATAVLVAVYERVRVADRTFALWGVLLAVAGSIGSAVHGGFDLAVLSKGAGRVRVPFNPVDPRGLMTFGVTAIGVFVLSWLILRGGALPRGLGYLGMASAVLSAILYAGRLVVVNPKAPGMLLVAVLAGFIVTPAWFVWLGTQLLGGAAAVPRRSTS